MQDAHHAEMTPYDARRSARDELLNVTERLIDEYPELPAGAVILQVARCRDRLLRTGVRAGLAAATESAVRLLLSDAVQEAELSA